MKYANATQHTQTLDKFEYFIEDLNCSLCLLYLLIEISTTHYN
jgi:hypothetical protein